MVIEVAVIPPIHGRELLSYSVPQPLASRAREGMRALVPLGRRQVTGVVIGSAGDGATGPLKDIIDFPDDEPLLTPDILALCRFAASYYLASIGEVLAAAVLSGLRARSHRTVRLVASRDAAERTPGLGRTEKEILRRLSPDRPVSSAHLLRSIGIGSVHEALRSLSARGLIALEDKPARAAAQIRYRTIFVAGTIPSEEGLSRIERRAPAQHALLELIRCAGAAGMTLEELGGARASVPLRALVERGWVRAIREETYRTVTEAGTPASRLDPTAAQRDAVLSIGEIVSERRFETVLLHGITGSGKTEVYLRSAEAALTAGLGAMVLVPEIALTEEVVRRFVSRFGSTVALLHSALSPGERWDEWRRLARREARVAVGARSAIFAPLPDLGVIVVDEEHDGAYKQEEGLRYNARDLAIVRARNASCPIVLGSATPSIESYWNARSGRYRLLELPERIERRPLPTVELVDLRAERPDGPDGIFAAKVRDALAETLEARSQSLVFLNRRGYAHYLQCIVCGHVIGCPNCSVTLTFHLRRRMLRCHHCDYRLAAPELCPECTGPSLQDVGIGTEQVEAALRTLFPAARIERMDRDTTSRKGAHRRILSAWRDERIDILVGTQMVTKGHDVPGVTLVAVIAADQALNFPDFRAAERTFQMLTQVAGRAGRGERPGRVLIQTYRPTHYAVRHAILHDYQAFADEELRHREALGYPPFARLVNLRFDGIDAARVEKAAREVTAALRATNDRLPRSQRAKILGPAPAPLERLRGRYRWQLLLKGGSPKILRGLVRPAAEAVRQTTRTTVRITSDVDPYGML